MENKSAIVVVLDRLSAGYVGAYGNTWVTTPTLDQLASQSFLSEHSLVTSDDLRAVYSHYWYGRELDSDTSGSVTESLPWSLPRACRQHAITTSLITDESQVAEHPAAEYFDEPRLVRAPQSTKAAGVISEIQFTSLLAEAAEAVQQSVSPYLLWIHARGLAGPWDAPYALRQQLADDDDPNPPASIVPPQLVVHRSVDPDQLLGYVQSYAAQVKAIDACLAPLIDLLPPPDSTEQTLLALTSSRGYPLGQHAVVGGLQAKPYGDLLHVPFMLRLPQAASAAVRSQVLWQPADLAATLCDWLELEAGPGRPWGYSSLPLALGSANTTRDRAVAQVGGHAALRTEHWLLVELDVSQLAPTAVSHEAEMTDADLGEREGEGSRELYVKPDDRWEVNNVADRLPEVTASLARVAGETRALLAEPPPGTTTSAASQEVALPPLPDELTQRLD